MTIVFEQAPTCSGTERGRTRSVVGRRPQPGYDRGMQRIILRTAETIERFVRWAVGGVLVAVAAVGARFLGRGKHRDWRRREEEAAAKRRAERPGP